MNLSWLFGSSMEAHHLLWTYLVVRVIQGGYAGWIALDWVRNKRNSSSSSVTDEDSDI